MSSWRPGMSTTLPRNFAPPGWDGADQPRTPDQTFAELKLPPPPHHSTLRARRPPIHVDHVTMRNNALPTTLFASDIPIPSIEVVPQPEPARPAWQQRATEPGPSDRLRLPVAPHLSRPRTPEAQCTTVVPPEVKQSVWSLHRPSSSNSIRSDSSLSSDGSMVSGPTSFGGSATSPESDSQDPFMPRTLKVIPDTPSRPSKSYRFRPPIPAKPRWSVEMDNHLWNVYQLYVADPTITPFKTVPGSLPPLGVCHRIARKARDTWPMATPVSHPMVNRHSFRQVWEDRSGLRDATPEMTDGVESGDETPRGASPDASRGPWPKESATRRRLKELCKEKFSIAPHYQRMRESRSPSPFMDQFSRRPSSARTARPSRQASASRDSSVSYATRDLSISLIASGATGPLAKLVTDDAVPPRPHADEWFNTPLASSASPPGSSSHLGVGRDTVMTTASKSLAPDTHLHAAGSPPRLASPFSYNTWDGPVRSRHQTRPSLGQNQYDTVHGTGSRLLSPVNFDPFSNAHKRRARHQLADEPNRAVVEARPQPKKELVFTGSGDISQRRIRVRSRGATLSAINSQERVDHLFAPPPPPPPPPTNLVPDGRTNPAPWLGLAPPDTDDRLKRLGSPFELDPNKRSNRSKSPRPVAHAASLSDPFVSNPSATQSNTQSIGERLAAFSAMQNHQSRHLF